MKNTSMTLLIAAWLSLSSFMGVETHAKVEVTTTDAIKAHRVYAGPEFFCSHFKGGLENHALKVDLSLTRNIYYGGLRFGYEYLRPNAFYADTDAVAALGSTRANIRREKDEIKRDKNPKDHIRETFRGHKGHFWTTIEQRLGYTFSSSLIPSCSLSLFAAPGYHYEHVKGSEAHWWYAATGLKTLQQFTKHFHVGCDFKVMYAFAAHDHSTLTLPTTLGKKEFWGYEVTLPLEWMIGDSRAFDIQLKPYLLKFNAQSAETIYGARVELGYNF